MVLLNWDIEMDGGQGDDNEVNGVQPTPSHQLMKHRRVDDNHDRRVKVDRACPGIEEYIQ